MKKFFKTVFFVSLTAVFLILAYVVLKLLFSDGASGSTGIIGGADGPTAMLATRTLVYGTPLSWLLFVALVLLVVSVIGWMLTCHKQKKQ